MKILFENQLSKIFDPDSRGKYYPQVDPYIDYEIDDFIFDRIRDNIIKITWA